MPSSLSVEAVNMRNVDIIVCRVSTCMTLTLRIAIEVLTRCFRSSEVERSDNVFLVLIESEPVDSVIVIDKSRLDRSRIRRLFVIGGMLRMLQIAPAPHITRTSSQLLTSSVLKTDRASHAPRVGQT